MPKYYSKKKAFAPKKSPIFPRSGNRRLSANAPGVSKFGMVEGFVGSRRRHYRRRHYRKHRHHHRHHGNKIVLGMSGPKMHYEKIASKLLISATTPGTDVVTDPLANFQFYFPF